MAFHTPSRLPAAPRAGAKAIRDLVSHALTVHGPPTLRRVRRAPLGVAGRHRVDGDAKVDYSAPSGPSGFAGYWTFSFLDEESADGPKRSDGRGGRIGFN